MQKKFFFTPTYLHFFFSDRYRKQTISFFRPYLLIDGMSVSLKCCSHFLSEYNNNSPNAEPCDESNPDRADPEKACKFDLNVLGSECTAQKDYGYFEGTPCVLVKLNKVREILELIRSNRRLELLLVAPPPASTRAAITACRVRRKCK